MLRADLTAEDPAAAAAAAADQPVVSLMRLETPEGRFRSEGLTVMSEVLARKK